MNYRVHITVQPAADHREDVLVSVRNCVSAPREFKVLGASIAEFNGKLRISMRLRASSRARVLEHVVAAVTEKSSDSRRGDLEGGKMKLSEKSV